MSKALVEYAMKAKMVPLRAAFAMTAIVGALYFIEAIPTMPAFFVLVGSWSTAILARLNL